MNGASYNVALYAQDAAGNFSSYGYLANASGTSITPLVNTVVTLGDGVDAGNATVTPSSATTFADSFTLRTDKATANVSQVLVNLASGAKNDGVTWSTQTSAADNSWKSVTYGNGLFVAVAYSGTGNRVMTSFDGLTWTSRTSAVDNNWLSVTYGNGLFVAVSSNGTGNRVMTSPDGITWTSRTSAADNDWTSVTYGNGLFVAVACGVSATTCNATVGNRIKIGRASCRERVYVLV